MKCLYRASRALGRVYFSLLYRFQVFGVENVPQCGAILAPNHVSFYDPLLVGAACPEEVHFLGDAWLFDVFFVGWVIRHHMNTYPVAEHGRSHTSMRMLCDRLEHQRKVVIFPEGKRSRDGKVGRVRLGVPMLSLRANVPVVPIYIHGAYEVWPRGQLLPRLWGRIACVFGSPIYPGAYSAMEPREARDALGADLRKALEDLREGYLKELER